MSDLVTVILAAGKGTRMKSKLPKVLHKVAGKPMVNHVLDAAKAAGAVRNIVVTGFGGEMVRQAIDAECVEQKEQLGTGHAVLQTKELLEGTDGVVMVLCGDTPLLTGELLTSLYEAHKRIGGVATVLTAIVPNPMGYGRVIRRPDETFLKIVEEKDATEEEQRVKEINSGIYCFNIKELFSALAEVKNDNAQGEYYLPDVLEILGARGEKIAAYATKNYDLTLGINSRAQLAAAEKILRKRKNDELMADGVTLMDPDTTFIDADVKIGRDTVIYPFTWIEGNTVIGEDCELGPNIRLQNATLGNGVTGQFTYVHDAVIDDNVTLGQFVHIRPDSHLMSGVKIGNFVEVKNSNVGNNTKLPHLSYIGDSDIGDDVNMGCGTITVNYDGKKKFRTKVGNRAFVGCNSNLVAPVEVEDDAYIGAGSTITENVPKSALALGRARQVNIHEWKDKRK
ncbi:MAG: bifunctional UDP-N-acetylglucosamine diphosphorylase/glucosamine-1-phosphate N-acetyltransferase GlmU [Selenomonadaceae bacterium]|nr:bifunctional UDP-N-acetylglucosamine diphosphorylase/glucosamine-1-phosphate N-acetyltransferase GlmU [Selenomonadaceae bacterium]